MPEKYYYTKGKYSGLIYEKLLEAMLDDDPQHPGIYQWRRWYVRKNQHGVVPTLTANQGGGGHNVCIVKTKYGIRKMTPRECFNAQGFPASFHLPDEPSRMPKAISSSSRNFPQKTSSRSSQASSQIPMKERIPSITPSVKPFGMHSTRVNSISTMNSRSVTSILQVFLMNRVS